jgi:hypothetical protein
MAPEVRDWTRQLQTLLTRIRHGRRWQSDCTPPEEELERLSPDDRSCTEGGRAAAIRKREEASDALDRLVARLRAESPDELAAWVDGHDVNLAAFLDVCAARCGAFGDDAASTARRVRTFWAEVRTGGRAHVDEDLAYDMIMVDQYRRMFGIDPEAILPDE